MWEMEIEEMESVLEKIWDLHDKLSDAIHSISRSHFLSSINSLRKINNNKPPSSFNNNNKHQQRPSAPDEANNKTHQSGFVFVKDFRPDDEENDFLAVQEAKSLNAIRTALESLEDQLEFFHTVQVQQRAERDAAVARLEQSRIVLAMRLAEHQGKKYRVIEEAVAFVGDVRDACNFVSPENLYASAPYPPSENFKPPAGKRSSNLFKFFVASFNFAKNSLRMDQMGGVLGNAALVAISMLAFVQLHQASCNNKYFLDLPQKKEEAFNNRKGDSSSSGQLTHLDVMLARG